MLVFCSQGNEFVNALSLHANTPLRSLQDQSLTLRCPCGWAGAMPVRKLAAEFRPHRSLGDVLRRVHCRRCERPVNELADALLVPDHVPAKGGRRGSVVEPEASAAPSA